jgi:methionyl-tRNA formyltransferase
VAGSSLAPAQPGSVFEVAPDRLVVAAGEGAVRLLIVQLPGKKLMPTAEFLRGHVVQEGDLMR